MASGAAVTKYVIRSLKTGLYLREALGGYVWRQPLGFTEDWYGVDAPTLYDTMTEATLSATEFGLADWEVAQVAVPTNEE